MAAASGSVKIAPSGIPGAGRGLFACQVFKPGDVVASVDRPFVAELESDRLEDTCAWCFQRGETDPEARARAASIGMPAGFIETKACAGCHRVSYCSKTCQSRAWKREHKYECPVIAPPRPDLPHSVRAAIKLLGRLKAADPAGPEHKKILDLLMEFRPAGAGNRLEAFKELDKQKFDDYNMLAWAAWSYCGKPGMYGAVDSRAGATGFVFNLLCNSFILASPVDGVKFGIGFDNTICAANHSCDPNVVMTFLQPKVELRALRPIKSGEEIFVKYVDVTNPMGVRQSELKDTYFFDCKCSKCSKGANSAEDRFAQGPEELPTRYHAIADTLIKKHEAQLSHFLVSPLDTATTAQKRVAAMEVEAFFISGTTLGGGDSVQSDEETIRNALKMCLDSGMWSHSRQPVPQLCRQLFQMYLETGSPYRAFRIGLKAYFEVLPKVYPQEFYPDRIIDTWGLAAVANILCGPAFAEIYGELQASGVDLRVVFIGLLFDVYDQLPRMYGLASPFGKVMENTYKQIVAGMGLSEAELRERVKQTWPSLETAARSIDLLKD
ncbi:SET domain-containing protein [Apiospora arundinis]|uniref:Suppressor of anucleate metulae protein B n=1 Tax=Apiospora arundinis TaxID=335852 RepID=A0ABR2J718_9PEZI